MLLRIIFSGLVFSIVISGCASLSKDECINANWDAIGYRDGCHGKLASRFNTHQKACAKHGIRADFALYKDGHQRGLEEVYCKPGNGYRLGLNGKGYDNICPSGIEPEFLAAYHYGRDIHGMQRSYRVLEQQAGALKADLAAVDERIAALERDINGDDWADRANQVKHLRREHRKVKAQYDRIKLIRPMLIQSQTLVEHLQREITTHNRRVKHDVTRIIDKSALQDGNRRQLTILIRLSNEKGRIESHVKWINRTPQVASTHRKQTRRLQDQLRKLLPRINGLKHDLFRILKNKKDKTSRRSTSYYVARLEQLMVQAEYEGALSYHNEVLEYMESYRRDQPTLYLLIDAHFEVELANIDQRIDNARHRQPTEEAWKAQMKRKRELQGAQKKHDDYIRRIDDMEQQLDNMHQKIEQLKSASRY